MKNFRSLSGEPVYLALLSGHVTYVTGEWGPLHERFHSAAYANGCVSEDMEVHKELEVAAKTGVLDQAKKDAELKSKVRTVIQKAIDNDNLDAFTKAGNPKAGYIREEMGHTVQNHIVSSVWSAMQKDGIVLPDEEEEGFRNDIA